MEQNSAENPVINPKALIITLLILLFIPVVYVLFIKEEAPEPAPVATDQTTQPVTPVPVETTPPTEAAQPTQTGTTEQIESLKKAIATNPTEINYLNLGMAYYYNKQYSDCIAASRMALSINPNNALAYNNICSAFNSMNMWDSAIVAGNEAVRLEPDFELARNNLNWALSMKKK